MKRLNRQLFKKRLWIRTFPRLIGLLKNNTFLRVIGLLKNNNTFLRVIGLLKDNNIFLRLIGLPKYKNGRVRQNIYAVSLWLQDGP